jgi:ubiquitin-like-conjugating enzyme ATG10
MQKISYSQFVSDITKISSISQKYSAFLWELKSEDGISFLISKVWKSGSRVKNENSNTTILEDNSVEIVPDISASATEIKSTYYYEYHIVYSEAYNTPVIYFLARGNEDQLLSLEEIPNLPELNDQMIISQQMHPILDRPFYFLHPCNTSKFMFHLDTTLPTGMKTNKED